MFQVLDWQVLKDNPQAQKDPTVTFTYRIILYGGYITAIVLAFIIPMSSLIVAGIISVTMLVVMFFD